MKIDLNCMKERTRNFLKILAENKILEFEDVKKNVRKTFFIDKINNLVLITIVPSLYVKSIEEYAIMYFENRQLNYIEAIPTIRINPQTGNSSIIIKVDEKVPGYDVISVDRSLDAVQMRTLQSTNLPKIKGELERLLEINKSYLGNIF